MDRETATEKFNALPEDVRLICCESSRWTNINYLEREKARLKERYTQSIREINAHIKNIKSYKWED